MNQPPIHSILSEAIQEMRHHLELERSKRANELAAVRDDIEAIRLEIHGVERRLDHMDDRLAANNIGY